MEVNTRNFRDNQSIQLSQCITSIEVCLDYIAVGCLDDSLYLWNADPNKFSKEPLFTRNGNAMGIIDLAFNRKSTHLAVSCMDSTIRIYDLNSYNNSNIQCQAMENWKVQFLDQNVITAGDLGKLNYYDFTSKERVKKIDLGEVFLTSLAKSNDNGLVACGNNNGDLYIVNLNSKKQKIAALKPHYKLVRSLAFLEDSSKLITGSDDNTIKIIDIASQKVGFILEGHKQAISSVTPHQLDNKLIISSSFDKTVKCWDLRQKSCIGTAITGSAVWACKSSGKRIVTGGENGILNIYSLE